MVIQQQTIRPISSAWRKILSWLSYKFWYKEHEHREEPSLDLHTLLLIMSLVSVHHHTHIFTIITWLTQIIRIVGISLRIVLNAFVLWVFTLYTPGHYKTKQSKSSLFMTRHWSIITPNNCHRLHWQPCYWTRRPHHQQLKTLTFTIYRSASQKQKEKVFTIYSVETLYILTRNWCLWVWGQSGDDTPVETPYALTGKRDFLSITPSRAY